MLKKSTQEAIFAGVLFVAAAWAAATSWGYGVGGIAGLGHSESGALEPGTVPFLVSLVLAALAVAVGLNARRSSGAGQGDAVEPEADAASDSPVGADAGTSGTAERESSTSTSTWIEMELEEEFGDASLGKVVAVFGVLVLAVAAIPHLGFLPSLGLFLFVVLRFMERRSWLKALVVTLISVLVLYLVLVQLLELRLSPMYPTFFE